MLRTARTADSIIRKLSEQRMTREHTVTLLLPDATVQRLQVSEEEPVLIAAFHQGLDLPSLCLQGWCLTCAGRVVNEDSDWDPALARRYYDEDREAGFILLCTAIAKSDLTVRTHQRVAMRDYRRSIGLPAPEEGGVE